MKLDCNRSSVVMTSGGCPLALFLQYWVLTNQLLYGILQSETWMNNRLGRALGARHYEREILITGTRLEIDAND
jgi:hypothetical protein